MNQDAQHLESLSTAFKVVGVVYATCVNVFWLHVAAGIYTLSNPPVVKNSIDSFPSFFGGAFIAAGLFAIISGWTVGILNWRAGTMISQRKGHTFCVVISAINLIFQPIGMVLGILALIVLNRPSVRSMFFPAPDNPYCE